MRRSRAPVPQRLRVFLGCEGESERGYGALLQRLMEAKRQHVHLDVVLLKPGAGDPLALVERAQRQIIENERKRETRYATRALLLDADRVGQTPARDVKMRAIVQAVKLRLIWQEPCHEAFLLRHLDGCRDHRPPTSSLAMTELLRRWPGYAKGSPATQLAERITATHVEQAAAVEPELRGFLGDIGFL